jgi:hypothetical protein
VPLKALRVRDTKYPQKSTWQGFPKRGKPDNDPSLDHREVEKDVAILKGFLYFRKSKKRPLFSENLTR